MFIRFKVHKKRAEKYYSVKSGYITKSKTSNDVLVLEFDYSQNLPLPKLNITKQFYKRLWWMFVFNVHCHNDDSSIFYSFLESQSKKGPHSVASFLFHCVSKKVNEYPNLKSIVLLSDAAGGQNKNSVMLRFCLWLSITFRVEVVHMFPVRGHSFGQCDRNFGLIKSKLKNKPQIETPELYLESIVECRQNPSPFKSVNDPSLIYNWDKAILQYFLKTPVSRDNVFKVQQYSILKYKPCGTLLCSKSYTEIFQPFKYIKTHHTEISLEQVPCVPLKDAKVKDIRDLFPYLSDEGKSFYEALFKRNDVSETVVENKEEETDMELEEEDNVIFINFLSPCLLYTSRCV